MNCPFCKQPIKKAKKKCCPHCGGRLKKGFSPEALLCFLAGALLLANVFTHWLFGAAAVFAFLAGILFLLFREYKK